MNDVEIIDVWKRYKWLQDRPFNLKESLLRLAMPGKDRTDEVVMEYWALQGASLNVSRGETFGLIGDNGAGKTTLLKLIAGLVQPTRGHVARAQRAAMMELGVGFHPDFSGRENAYTNGIVAGLTKKEMDAAFPKIVEFAELEQSIDRPVRTYSGGMYMRLAFSLAVHLKHQILLIDEVLAVGDQNFQRKCLDRIYDIKEQRRTIVIVSHDLAMVRKLCDRVCWLERGRVRQTGSADDVIDAYLAHSENKRGARLEGEHTQALTPGPQDLTTGVNRWGSLRVVVENVRLRNSRQEQRDVFEAAEGMEIEIDYRCQVTVIEAIFQITICRADGMKCIETDSWSGGLTATRLADRGTVSLSIDRLELGEGAYTLSVGAYSGDWLEVFDYQWQSYSFEVFSTSRAVWKTVSNRVDATGRTEIRKVR